MNKSAAYFGHTVTHKPTKNTQISPKISKIRTFYPQHPPPFKANRPFLKPCTHQKKENISPKQTTTPYKKEFTLYAYSFRGQPTIFRVGRLAGFSLADRVPVFFGLVYVVGSLCFN